MRRRTLTSEADWLTYARAAHAAGVPEDQLRRFMSAGYIAQPKQLQFHALAREVDTWQDTATPEIGLGGSRGPGKSHSVFAQLALDDCQRYDGLKFLYLRKIGAAAREAMDDLRRNVLAGVPHEYNRSEGVIYFPNGSRIITGHFKDERDIDKYIGIEYDGAAIEEATTLSLKKYEMLLGSVRSSKEGWKPRVYVTTNPGSTGHAWFKARFVIPARRGTEREGNTRFIFATYKDNAYLNPEYVAWLESLTGWLGRAWRDGDWDIMAGMFFTTFRHEVHVIKPFVVPRSWYWWGALDYGFVHPTVFYLLAEDGDGNVYVVAEHWAQRWLPERHVDSIGHILNRFALADLEPVTDKDPYHKVGFNILSKTVAGVDAFAQRGNESGKTIAEQYAARGLPLTRATMDRINRAAEVLRRLGDVDPEEGGKRVEPSLFIFDTCTHLIECLPAMQHDPDRPEDVLKVDVEEDGTGGDDPYDALSMGIMERRLRKTETQHLRYVHEPVKVGGPRGWPFS